MSVIKECECCGQTFNAFRINVRFCSNRCRQLYHHRRQNERKDHKDIPVPADVKLAKTVRIINIPDENGWDEIGRVLPRIAFVEMVKNGYCFENTKIRARGKDFMVCGRELGVQRLVPILGDWNERSTTTR